jgi:hypothetical protein
MQHVEDVPVSTVGDILTIVPDVVPLQVADVQVPPPVFAKTDRDPKPLPAFDESPDAYPKPLPATW